jgi:hypothetical protein
MNIIQKIELRFGKRSDTQSRIDSVCKGYSSYLHWRAFKTIFSALRGHNILILWVYQGRDIAYMVSILRSLGISKYTITGVDKFDDSPGNDWPEEKHGMSWQEAGFGLPPSIELAKANLSQLGLFENVSLIKGRADEILRDTKGTYDFIYIDVSHDYETTLSCIDLSMRKLALKGYLGGDDFSDNGTWGVASAVRESFSPFKLYYDYIWFAQASEYVKKQGWSLENTRTEV